MAQTAAITASTSAATSSDITVTTTPITLTMYTTETDGAFGRAKIQVQTKLGSNYVNLEDGRVDKRNGDVYLQSYNRRGYTLTSPGTYRLVKSATSKSVGVYQDTTA